MVGKLSIKIYINLGYGKSDAGGINIKTHKKRT